jgi:hypothetical protein
MSGETPEQQRSKEAGQLRELEELSDYFKQQMSSSRGVLIQNISANREETVSAYIFDVVEQGQKDISAHKRIGVSERGVRRERDFDPYFTRDVTGFHERRDLEYLEIQAVKKLNSDRVCLTVSLGTGESTQVYFGGEEEEE